MEEDNLKSTNFDKLKSLRNEAETFNFLCEECKSANIEIVPIGLVVRPIEADNSDLEKVDRELMIRLNNLPSIQKAIKESRKEDLVYRCEDCKYSASIKKAVGENELRRWVKKHIGEENLFLGSRE